MKTESRIWFAENPWPGGHRVVRFDWSGRLDDRGLWFDLHLQSAAYTEGDRAANDGDDDDDNSEDDSRGDWRSRGVWSNYGRCTLSSTMWPGYHAGLLVGTADAPFDWRQLARRDLHADPAPPHSARVAELGAGPRAFGLYLLGHDTSADHRLRFSAPGPGAVLRWSGQIALTYVGATELRHRFSAVIAQPRFAGFTIAPGLPIDVAEDLLGVFTAAPSQYRRVGQRFVPIV